MIGRISIAAANRPVLAARICVWLLPFLWMLPAPSAVAAECGGAKRVLLLHSFGRDFLPWSEYARSIKASLEQQSPWPLDLQEHTLLTARFNNPGPEAPFVDYLGSLYQECPPNIVVSIGAPAARFVQKYRGHLFPEAPAVLTVVEERLVNRPALTGNDAVVSVRNDFPAAFGNVLRVLPDTRTIAVVIGASRLEQFWLEELRKELQPLEARVALVYYAGLPFEEILKRASALPPHTALFWGLMSVDGAGIMQEGDLALRRLRAVANAPIFSYQEAFFNHETVGGPMHSIAATSTRTVDAVIRILNGEAPSNIEIEPVGFAAPKYDWRELRRWGIEESNLPPDSEVMFRAPEPWREYRWQIVMITAVMLVQAALISGLLHERRRRRLAEVESRQRLTELAHVNRYTVVGTMTTSIAHELNQPLCAILANTETAEVMLKGASPDLNEIKEILADIKRDDQRASEVVRRIRSVLKKAPFEIRQIDLNDTVRETVDLVATEARRRGVALKFSAVSGDLPVKGDVVQLQQVILNLIINAMDAMTEADVRTPEVSLATARSNGYAEIRVGDTGAGVPADDLKNIFEPFFSTKPQGMGMGLAIVRTIIEAHRGEIFAENQASGGALFTIRLPIAVGRPAAA